MIFPEFRKSKTKLKRLKFEGVENPIIAQIREGEMANPAPFSDRVLYVASDNDDYTLPSSAKVLGDFPDHETGDIPILQIVGVNNSNNMEHIAGMTFREVLFEALHGATLCEDSLDYFLSNDLKDGRFINNKSFRYFDQNDRFIKSKVYGRKGIQGTRLGQNFYINQGQQRSILAMFWIWQSRPENLMLQNVQVSSY